MKATTLGRTLNQSRTAELKTMRTQGRRSEPPRNRPVRYAIALPGEPRLTGYRPYSAY